MNKAEKFYQESEKKYHSEAHKLKQQHRVIATVRVAFFVFSISLLVYFANQRAIYNLTSSLVFFLAIFVILVKKHQRISYRLQLANFLKSINQNEQQRLHGNFKEITPNGAEYQDLKHAYSSDLDIFGKNSLFQFISRTATTLGGNTLASWLKNKAEKIEITARQEAVKELSEKVEWRQEFQARGMFAKATPQDVQLFSDWLHKKPILFHQKIYLFLPIIFSLSAITTLVLYFVFDFPLIYPFAALIFNGLIIGKTAKKITALFTETVKHLETLTAFSHLISMIENASFSSSKLQELQQKLVVENEIASKQIGQLTKILQNLEARNNVFFALSINLVFLYEIIFTWQLEKWKSKRKTSLLQWFQVVADFEALNSFAALSFSYPEFCFPKISEKPFVYKAKNLGHLLIDKKNSVSNDFELHGKGKITIITGSNMAGKSTFLRTLGVNATLALAGSPVCASELEISCFDTFTGLRISDSLEENVSAFYAELQRIKMLFDKLENGETVFFMLDEILKGTNSKDRHTGVYNIVKRLISQKAFGLISTHDLELASLSNSYQEIENKSFGSSITEGTLKFNYKLENGICKSFSATQLMKNIGIIE